MTGGPEYQLKIDQGTVYGARYYTVQPLGWGWFEGEVRWAEMMTWTVSTFGPSHGSIWAENTAPNPGERWYVNNSKFWFRKEEDLTLFVLKWS